MLYYKSETRLLNLIFFSQKYTKDLYSFILEQFWIYLFSYIIGKFMHWICAYKAHLNSTKLTT